MLRAAIDHPKFGPMIKNLHSHLIAGDALMNIQNLDQETRAAILREIISHIAEEPLEQVMLVTEAFIFCRESLGFEFYERK